MPCRLKAEFYNAISQIDWRFPIKALSRTFCIIYKRIGSKPKQTVRELRI